MRTYIAFLRGINVGGHKKILMSDLKELFKALGFTHVITYIQSGNVIFSASTDVGLSKRIGEGIKEKYGWDVSVFVRTPAEIANILEKCPFSDEKKHKSYFILLSEAPDKTLIAELSEFKSNDETFLIAPGCVYFYSGTGYGNTKFNNNFFERKLKVLGTARNYRTLTKLIELVR